MYVHARWVACTIYAQHHVYLCICEAGQKGPHLVLLMPPGGPFERLAPREERSSDVPSCFGLTTMHRRQQC